MHEQRNGTRTPFDVADASGRSVDILTLGFEQLGVHVAPLVASIGAYLDASGCKDFGADSYRGAGTPSNNVRGHGSRGALPDRQGLSLSASPDSLRSPKSG